MQADSSFKATWSSSLLKEPPSVTYRHSTPCALNRHIYVAVFPRTTHASSCIIPPALTCCLQKTRRTPLGHPSASHRGLKNQNKVLSCFHLRAEDGPKDLFLYRNATIQQSVLVFFSGWSVMAICDKRNFMSKWMVSTGSVFSLSSLSWGLNHHFSAAMLSDQR